MSIAVVAHCDWSLNPAKRWMAVAIKENAAWTLYPPEIVGEVASLPERLSTRRRAAGAVLAGFDFPIGLPEAYARQTGLASFKEALGVFGSGSWSDWYSVAERREQISIHRPFYPMRPGGTSRAHHVEALFLAGREDMLRRCERQTSLRQAACSIFWTLGGNQVGKAAITGWRELIIPQLATIGLWPFDGRLHELASKKALVIAETYPGDVYAQLGLPRRGWSKKNVTDRRRIAGVTRSWLADRPALESKHILSALDDGFGADTAGEDRFDALVGLLGMLDVVTGRRDEGCPETEAIRLWEGWILGHQRTKIQDGGAGQDRICRCRPYQVIWRGRIVADNQRCRKLRARHALNRRLFSVLISASTCPLLGCVCF